MARVDNFDGVDKIREQADRIDIKSFRNGCACVMNLPRLCTTSEYSSRLHLRTSGFEEGIPGRDRRLENRSDNNRILPEKDLETDLFAFLSHFQTLQKRSTRCSHGRCGGTHVFPLKK